MDETRQWDVFSENNELKLENNELRELLHDVWHRAMQLMDSAERYAFEREFIDRMRDLEE